MLGVPGAHGSAEGVERAAGVILGCTEIPIMLAGRIDEDDPTLINPTALIAEAAVRHAIG